MIFDQTNIREWNKEKSGMKNVTVSEKKSDKFELFSEFNKSGHTKVLLTFKNYPIDNES